MGAYDDQVRHRERKLAEALREAENELQRYRATPLPVLLGWWCWRCEGFNEQACRSDSVPVYVPAEWLTDMRKTLINEEDE